MRLVVLFLAGLSLSACSDWPDFGEEASQARSAPWPILRPLSEVLAGSESSITEVDGRKLTARAAALRARAAILRRPVADDAAFEAMRARLGTL